MYLLDTNVISELRRQKPHGGVVAWLDAAKDSDLFISAFTVAEIQAGIELTRDQNPQTADELEGWLDKVAATYNILSMDELTFRLWAKLMHKQSDTLYEDAMIAATAQAKDLAVVTRNVSDFECFKVDIINPFEPKNLS